MTGKLRWILVLAAVVLVVASFEIAYSWKSTRLEERIGEPVDGRLEKTDAEWRQ